MVLQNAAVILSCFCRYGDGSSAKEIGAMIEVRGPQPFKEAMELDRIVE